MRLIELTSDSFESISRRDEFHSNYDGEDFSLTLSDLTEIRMSVYLYHSVKFYKSNRLEKSGRMIMPEKQYNPISPDNKYIFIPFQDGFEIINIPEGKNLKLKPDGFCSNLYDTESKYLIINCVDSVRIIDLNNLKEVHVGIESKKYTNDAFFVDTGQAFQMKGNSIIEQIWPNDGIQSRYRIKTPYELFSVEGSKYQKIEKMNTHCLGIKNGGMLYSGLLNNWNFYGTAQKIIFNTVIPISEIRFSETYNREYCMVEYRYVELVN